MKTVPVAPGVPWIWPNKSSWDPVTEEHHTTWRHVTRDVTWCGSHQAHRITPYYHIISVTCTLLPCNFYLNLGTCKYCLLIGSHNAGLYASRAYWLVTMETVCCLLLGILSHWIALDKAIVFIANSNICVSREVSVWHVRRDVRSLEPAVKRIPVTWDDSHVTPPIFLWSQFIVTMMSTRDMIMYGGHRLFSSEDVTCIFN